MQRNRQLCSIVIPVLMIAFGCCVWGQDTAQERVAEANAISVTQAYAATMDGLRCFDVAIAGEVFRMGPENPSDSLFYWRIIADYDQKKFLLLSDSREQQIAIDPQARSERRGVTASFIDAKAGEVWQRFGGDQPRRIGVSQTDVDEIAYRGLSGTGLSDPRLIGLTPFPSGFYPIPSIREVVRRTFGRFESLTSRRIDDDTTGITITHSATEISSVRHGYHFDDELLVPVRVTFEAGNRGEFRKTKQESITWKELGGHVVPVEIIGERIRELSRTGPEESEESYRILLRWKHLNEPDKLEALEVATLSEMERILSLFRDARELVE